jgi:hypothetical protein
MSNASGQARHTPHSELDLLTATHDVTGRSVGKVSVEA